MRVGRAWSAVRGQRLRLGQGGRCFKGSGPGKAPFFDLSSPTSPEAVDSGKLSESSGMSNFTPLKEESCWAGEPSTSEVDGSPCFSPSLLGIALPVEHVEPVEPVVSQPVAVTGKCSLLSCYVCYPSAMRGGDGLTPTTRINGQYIYFPRAANEKLDVLRGSFAEANQLSRAIPTTNPIPGAPMPPVAQYSTYTAFNQCRALHLDWQFSLPRTKVLLALITRAYTNLFLRILDPSRAPCQFRQSLRRK